MQVPMPNDWNGVAFCRWAICWPDSSMWQAILHGLVETPTQGRFWDFSTGNFEELRESFLPAYEHNFKFDEVIMACNDTGLADALNSIALAISGLSAGDCGCASTTVNCGAGGAGGAPVAPTTIEGPVADGSDPPAGFETLQDYRDYKCAIATHIVSTYVDDLQRLSQIASNVEWVASKLAVVAAGLLLTPIPGDELFAISAAIAVAIASDVWSDSLTLLQNSASEIQADLVCALYEAGDVGAAVSNFQSVLTEEINASGTLPYTYIAASTISPFTAADNLNRLFAKDTSLSLPVGDCSGCGPEEFPVLQQRGVDGNWVDSDLTWGEEVTFEPVQEGNGFYYAFLRLTPQEGLGAGQFKFVVSNSSYSNTGSCSDDFAGPGTYNNVELEDYPGEFGWQFGCTNGGQTFFTGVFSAV